MRCLFCVEKTVCYFLFIFLLCFVFLKSIQKQKPRIALQNNVGITWNLWLQLSVVMMVPWQSLIGILMGFTYICTTPSYNDNPFELQRGGGRRTLTCWWSQYGCVSMSRTKKSDFRFFFFLPHMTNNWQFTSHTSGLSNHSLISCKKQIQKGKYI